MAETSSTHDHVDFLTASLVSARVCSGCGAYVSGGDIEKHQSFHDRLKALEIHSEEKLADD